MDRVKQWLTGTSGTLDDETEIIDLNECLHAGMPFANFKIIKWHHDHEISHQTQLELLQYVENGGIIL